MEQSSQLPKARAPLEKATLAATVFVLVCAGALMLGLPALGDGLIVLLVLVALGAQLAREARAPALAAAAGLGSLLHAAILITRSGQAYSSGGF